MREEYIQAINKRLENCQDIKLLDLIFQLLVKSAK